MTVSSESLTTASLTRRGSRPYNEDNVTVAISGPSALVLVADGVGGAPHGEEASRIAAEHFATAFHSAYSPENPAGFLEAAALEANRLILNNGEAKDDYLGMATTISGALIHPDGVHTVNAGDSRVYRLSQVGRMTRLTHDDSYVQELLDDDQLTEIEAFWHPQRNIITQHLGMPVRELSIEVRSHAALSAGELILAATDGLHDVHPDRDIKTLLLQHRNQDPESILDALWRSVNAKGAKDNCTMALAQRT